MTDIPRLSDEIRATLPLEAQAYLTALETVVSELRIELGELRVELKILQQQNSELLARTRQTSRNSSRPPSSDPPSAPSRPRRPSSPRKQGAQPGHKQHKRIMLPVEEVDEVIDHRPVQCPNCQAPLDANLPDVAEPERQQVWEVPEIKPHVVEHRYHRIACPDCQTTVQAERPAEVSSGAFGPGVVALVGLLHGRYRLSVREMVSLLLDVFHLPISPGSVIALCRLVSAALAVPYAESQAAVTQADHNNVDETGWKQAGKRRWLWVAVGVASTVFLVATHRSAHVLKSLLGDAFQGIVTSDRFKAYLALPVERRQVCWAHLKRNWLAFSERDGPVGAWGQRALKLIEQVFDLWHRFRGGGLDRTGLQREMQSVQTQLRQLLEEGPSLPLSKAQAFCRDLLALWPALWTFLVVEGVEPTNNAAERALRPAVLWRKSCFGTQSEDGNLFVARILTAVATCRQQERHVLTFLTDAVQAHLAGLPAPSLVSTR
jgi:transposase